MTVLQKFPVTDSISTIDSIFYLYPKISLNLSREGGKMRDTGKEVAKNSLLHGGAGQYFLQSLINWKSRNVPEMGLLTFEALLFLLDPPLQLFLTNSEEPAQSITDKYTIFPRGNLTQAFFVLT